MMIAYIKNNAKYTVMKISKKWEKNAEDWKNIEIISVSMCLLILKVNYVDWEVLTDVRKWVSNLTSFKINSHRKKASERTKRNQNRDLYYNWLIDQ